jgi:hypothetical protein
MAFRVVRQRREARRNAKLDEIFMVGTGGGLTNNYLLSYFNFLVLQFTEGLSISGSSPPKRYFNLKDPQWR